MKMQGLGEISLSFLHGANMEEVIQRVGLHSSPFAKGPMIFIHRTDAF